MLYKKVAVTGSSGFLGKHLTDELKEKGINVFEISRTNSIDVTVWEQVEKIPEQDLVFHLAGMANIQDAFKNPKKAYFINYVGTLNMLEWCRINDINKMVYVSTFVYGTPQYLPVDEKHPVVPNNPYSHSKLMGEELCRAYCRDYGLNVTILRLFNIYGPHQKGDFLIPHILRQLSSGEVIIRDSYPKRDFLYVSDAVNALVALLTSNINGCNVFNIGSGKSFSAGEVADMLADSYFKFTGNNISIKYNYNERKSEIADTIANIDKAKKVLNWVPQVDIKTGLSQILRAYIDENKG